MANPERDVVEVCEERIAVGASLRVPKTMRSVRRCYLLALCSALMVTGCSSNKLSGLHDEAAADGSGSSLNTGGSNDAAITECVCALDPYCCETKWDLPCVSEAAGDCAASCS